MIQKVGAAPITNRFGKVLKAVKREAKQAGYMATASNVGSDPAHDINFMLSYAVSKIATKAGKSKAIGQVKQQIKQAGAKATEAGLGNEPSFDIAYIASSAATKVINGVKNFISPKK